MSITKELGSSPARFRGYIERLIQLLQKHEIRSIRSLISAFRSDGEFSAEWRAIWKEIASADGGKISLATAGAVLGAVLGGVGIAAMGGAIGLPLYLVLGLGGLLMGAKYDAARGFSKGGFLVLRLPKELQARIRDVASADGVTDSELVIRTLSEAFPDLSDLEP